ncbi:MAG: RelA/SpoT domain-containing protein [Aliarcobacter sp.]|jgi:ppGpp synthetase/RelA/SpoT-type nucleotidyltranferase|uniref:RelA/SpoT domain-containing protein n=1 Tax=Aliarcobacter cryaerophilus TaxID=28198 RepID=UPI0016546306|nr:RelA/SpoT domain-containing protein [Aliarcobacter cryaerophilus]QNM87269.1 RelA/SpoT domain-containing protein [Aliarcobacter cryaerophilus]
MSETISKTKIKNIGNSIKNNSLSQDDLSIFSEWRSSHAILTRELAKTLKRKSIKNSIISRRLKRQPSIFAKLTRYPQMQLNRMQDIGGVRIILKNQKEVYKLSEELIKLYGSNKKAMFELKKPIDDYIANPKEYDGYRSIHHVYSYSGSSKQKEFLRGMFIELQIRTKIQHIWATTLEIFDIKNKSTLKIGGGNEEHREFFKLCSLVLSFIDKTTTDNEKENFNLEEVHTRLFELNNKYKILGLLSGLSVSINHIDKKNKNDFFILELDYSKSSLRITVPNSEEEAKYIYAGREQDIRIKNEPKEVVLVSGENMKSIEKAYPNYFLDAKNFINYISEFLDKKGAIWSMLN